MKLLLVVFSKNTSLTQWILDDLPWNRTCNICSWGWQPDALPIRPHWHVSYLHNSVVYWLLNGWINNFVASTKFQFIKRNKHEPTHNFELWTSITKFPNVIKPPFITKTGWYDKVDVLQCEKLGAFFFVKVQPSE